MGCEGVALQCLPYGLGTTTPYLLCQFLVGYCSATRDVEQGEIYLALEVADVAVVLHYAADVGHAVA